MSDDKLKGLGKALGAVLVVLIFVLTALAIIVLGVKAIMFLAAL